MAEKDIATELIAALIDGEFKKLGKVNPSGSLEVRRMASGAVQFYWRITIGAKGRREPIGLYDSSAPPKSLQPTGRGYSIKAAFRAAEGFALKHHANKESGGYPALVAAEKETKRTADIARQDARQYTVKALLDDYCDHLKALGRDAHRNAGSIFKVHVFEPWPQVAALPAKQATTEQFADMMRRAIESGKGRTANKLRSYIRAAYQTAIAARSSPSVPVHFKAYNIVDNPAANIPSGQSNNSAKNPLKGNDLRTYWNAIKAMPGFKGAVLRLHLLTGGQRIEQLVRLQTADVGNDVISLYDGKGRPGKPPREHLVPLVPLAAEAVRDCNSTGAFALSTDGTTHIAGTTLSNWAKEAAAGIDGFQAKRIRSGVETLLASLEVSKDIRGRLLSHGISGVQDVNYDGHDYLREKRDALMKLSNYLQRKAGAKVVPIGKRA